MDVRSELLRLKQGLETRDRDQITSASRSLIALKAPLGAQWNSVSTALAHSGEWGLALGAIDRLNADQPGTAATRAKANVLYAAGRIAEASALLDALGGDGANDPRARLFDLNMRASLALQLGRKDECRQWIAQALEQDPRSGQAWFTFAELADFRDRDAAARGPLDEAFAAGSSLPAEAAKLAHAAGKMHHQLGNHERAFAAYRAGAELFRAQPGNDVRPQSRLAERSIAFPLDLIRRVQQRITVDHSEVIFVSGLPRSGTTLVEQILVSHPEVTHGEELDLIPIVAQEIGGIDAADVARWLDSGGDPNTLVNLYLHLVRERFGAHRRFVDKSIEAGKYMGLLLALFPRAPVFWMLRDPLDNGWSAYRTMFARGASWSWDLEHIGQRLAQEKAMVDHWSKAAPERITFVDYEALVRDPEPQIRSIADAAGLSLDERMLAPHATARTVATASAAQVREPINLKGLGVAAPYREWLQPMVEAYSAAARTSPAGSSTS